MFEIVRDNLRKCGKRVYRRGLEYKQAMEIAGRLNRRDKSKFIVYIVRKEK